MSAIVAGNLEFPQERDIRRMFVNGQGSKDGTQNSRASQKEGPTEPGRSASEPDSGVRGTPQTGVHSTQAYHSSLLSRDPSGAAIFRVIAYLQGHPLVHVAAHHDIRFQYSSPLFLNIRVGR
jgi:hypothetical protein